MQRSFHYSQASVRDLHVIGTRKTTASKVEVSAIEVRGEEMQPTPRFWRSFFNRFGMSDNVFRYFEPKEVFERIALRSSDSSFRYCVERDDEGARLLAVTSVQRPVIGYGEIVDLVKAYDASEIQYDQGVVTSTHRPRGGDRTFEIGGDKFQHRFVMETPVDGFSHPKIYLSFLRLICSNGAIGYSQAFRSDISLGKDLRHCISRALESYDNGDGYAALRQRFESAQVSWASVHECVQLYKTLLKLEEKKRQVTSPVLQEFNRLTGNLNQLYGLANLDALSAKRQRVLPAKCRIYDLLNFASEVATHYSTPEENRTLQAYIGTLLSDEYDMEGAAECAPEFDDFFLPSSDTAPRSSRN
ncbi:DUF932 domain-containing protein [Lignipirellula cremea]|uniref:DUF932 domain-containing protein n=1 Tax=Lignipirellula cremea TaxID=2528010 RepID=A0A518DTS5_9BACT|nr:DUF932 domain-containing protein [Lignipirellula cremea]QDU95235.1 hypothetical protein Pla8534_30500 [Lignipirellula cremea]